MKNLIILCIIVIACAPQKVELINDEKKLVDVVVDLYYAESAVKDLGPELKDSLMKLYKGQISEIHAVDMVSVEQDLVLMQNDTKRYMSFHKTVEDSVAVRVKETEKDKIKKTDKKK